MIYWEGPTTFVRTPFRPLARPSGRGRGLSGRLRALNPLSGAFAASEEEGNVFIVTVELRDSDRTGRGASLAEALKTIGPLPVRGVREVKIRWARKAGGPGSITAKAHSLGEALTIFAEKAVERLMDYPDSKPGEP